MDADREDMGVDGVRTEYAEEDVLLWQMEEV